MAEVHVELSMTLNLGNFQSLKVTAGLTDTVRNGELTEDAFDRVYDFVESELAVKVVDAKETLGD